MTTQVANHAAVLDEMRSTHSQMEAMWTLKYELERNVPHHSKTVVELMKVLLTTIVRGIGSEVESFPPWFMPKNHVVFHREAFARGSFGSVYRGVWGPGTEVVVKCLVADESTITSKARDKILAEISIWHQLNHPNVIKMLGASHVSSPPFIVCEEAPYGNLFEFLAKSEQNGRWMWRLLYQAALGLQYIHGMKVVHGDHPNIIGANESNSKWCDSRIGWSALASSRVFEEQTDVRLGRLLARDVHH